MKNKGLKMYVVLFYFCSTALLMAEPGSNDNTGTLEGGDSTTAPIDSYLWVLFAVGLLFVFMKLRSLQKRTI